MTIRHTHALTVACVVLMTGCSVHIGSRPEFDQAQAEAALATIPSPGPDWNRGETGIADAFNHEPPDAPSRINGGLWRNGEAVATHFVAKASPETASARCGEAANWIVTNQDLVPGEVAAPSVASLSADCRTWFAKIGPDGSYTVDIPGAGSTVDGAQYGSWITFRSTGQHVVLEATALARPATD